MLLNAKKLIGCNVYASDGSAGEVSAFYIDNRQWTVRYIAVETGSWFNSRQVLIPPDSFSRMDIASQKVNVTLTKEQVENCPDVDFNLMVSLGVEADKARHRGLATYGPESPSEMNLVHEIDESRVATSRGEKRFVTIEQYGSSLTAETIPYAKSLYRSSDLFRYDVEAADGMIGNIDDFLIDDNSWAIRYAVVDTSRLSVQRKALISPRWFEGVSDAHSQLSVNLSRNTILNGPEYDPARSIDAAYENRLYEYYEGSSPYIQWSFNKMLHSMPTGRQLRIALLSPAIIRWTADNWQTFKEIKTRDTNRGIHIAELPTDSLEPGTSVHFTFFWPRANHWENKNFSVKVGHAGRVPQMAKV